MRSILTIAAREYRSYFVTAMGYVVLLGFFLLIGFLFYEIARQAWPQNASLEYLFQDMTIILMFLAPLITMRTLSEERSSGSIEVLMTSPLREVEVVLGKYLGTLYVYGTLVAISLQYPLFLLAYSNKQADVGPILTGYLGVILVGATFLAIGLFLSAMTKNQVVAAFATFGVVLMLWIVNLFAMRATGDWAEVFRYIAISNRMEDLYRGVLDLKDIVFFVSMVFLFLYLAVRSVKSSRWR